MKHKILIVDDDESIRLVLQTYLAKDGHTLETAVDGLDAMEKIPVFRPELILLDINMPKMSGFEVLKRLKEDPATSGIPVFIMTALGQEVNIRRGYQLGAEEYITKPSNIAHLKLRINKFFEKKGNSGAVPKSIPKTPAMENLKLKVNSFLKAKSEAPTVDARIAGVVDIEQLKKKMRDLLGNK